MKKIPIKTILYTFLYTSIIILFLYSNLNLEEVIDSFMMHLGFNFRSIFTIITSITIFTFIVELFIHESQGEIAKSISEHIKKSQDFKWKYSQIMFVAYISFVFYLWGYWGVKEIKGLILDAKEFNFMSLILSIIGISLLVLLIVVLVEQLILKIKGRKKNHFKP